MLNRPITLREALIFIAGFLLLQAAFGIADELTLTTYYPSPYGVYNNLRTRGDTYLAVDSAGEVNIGTPPAATLGKLYVNGGTTSPAVRINTASQSEYALVLGNDSSSSGAAAFTARILDSGGTEIQQLLGSRQINIGASSAMGNEHHLTIYGNLRIVPPTACRTPPNMVPGIGVSTPCNANEYITWTPGLYIEGSSAQPSSFIYSDAANPLTFYQGFTITADPNGGAAPAAGTYWFQSVGIVAYCCPRNP